MVNFGTRQNRTDRFINHVFGCFALYGVGLLAMFSFLWVLFNAYVVARIVLVPLSGQASGECQSKGEEWHCKAPPLSRPFIAIGGGCPDRGKGVM